MKIDITSLCFGFKIEKENDSGTPAWATSIGQAPKGVCYIDTTREGLEEVIYGMMYKSHSDFENLKVRDVEGLDKKEEPRGERERMMFSVFEDVYVNNVKVDGIFTLSYEREDSQSHKNRLHICYAKYLTYNGHSNKETLKEMAKVLGCSEEGCWFVTDISIRNQQELHFTAIVVNSNNSMIYSSSKARKENWEKLMLEASGSNANINDETFQQIFYGAPGTGKSNTIKKQTAIAEEEGRVIRTTFHPDSDYSTFVGCYKPKMKESIITKDDVTTKEEKIVYAFCPQAFTNAYIKAWNTKEDVYLIIEEINRGNCAQIFGDLFQLLDRKNRVSEYPIDADSDLGNYIKIELKDSTRTDIPMEVKDGIKLMLPSNLYIWATMNTSDQSLFPIDSAFKRRWDWKYIPIKPHNENYKIQIDEVTYDWWRFLEKINQVINDTTSSEDKKLGYFFVKAEDKVIGADKFVSKVLFYLWNDVFKNYDFDNSIFDKEVNKKFAFSDFFQEDGSPDTDVVNQFLRKLDETIDKDKPFEEKPEKRQDKNATPSD